MTTGQGVRSERARVAAQSAGVSTSAPPKRATDMSHVEELKKNNQLAQRRGNFVVTTKGFWGSYPG